MWSCSDYEEVVVETRVGHIPWLGADPAVDIFFTRPRCIRKTRASLVTINRDAHVVEVKSQGQAEGKQQVVAKTRGLDKPDQHSTAIFLVAS